MIPQGDFPSCDCPCHACVRGNHAECRWPQLQAPKHGGKVLAPPPPPLPVCRCECLSCARGECSKCFRPNCDDPHCGLCAVVSMPRTISDGMLLAGLSDCGCPCESCVVGQCINCQSEQECRRFHLLAREAHARLVRAYTAKKSRGSLSRECF